MEKLSLSYSRRLSPASEVQLEVEVEGKADAEAEVEVEVEVADVSEMVCPTAGDFRSPQKDTKAFGTQLSYSRRLFGPAEK